MSIVAENHRFVIGVDTHSKHHVLAVMSAVTGVVTGISQFRNTAAGIASAIRWVVKHTGADAGALWAIEGCGSYGARIVKAVTEAGYRVIEAPKYQSGRGAGGKSDPLDAQRIAKACLALTDCEVRHPRNSDGIRAATQTLLTVREHMVRESTAAINALTAIVRTANLGVDARKPLTGKQITQISAWQRRETQSIEISVARAQAIRFAKRINHLKEELKENMKQLNDLIKQSPAAELLNEPGIGPVTAATTYAAWSHAGRIKSEAAFAALAGASPIPASSGNTTHNRLNRGGDRRLNHALHMAVVTRMRCDETTRNYVEKRLSEGKTKREIRRILKRYLARKIYRAITAAHRQPASTLPA